MSQYLKALAAGRRATRAAQYAAAISAFDQALQAHPNDPRAFAERGHASYLNKHYDQAEGDLARAAQGTDDRRLRAQVFYNLGLVREALGRDGTSAFALSNFLNATAAAKKKLAGKERCPVEVDRNPTVPEIAQYRDWLAFYADYQGAFLDTEVKPSTNAEARALFCDTAGCSGPKPWLVEIEGRKSFLVNESKEGLTVAPVALTWLMGGLNFCYPTVEASVLQRKDGMAVVQVHVVDGVPVTICDPDGHDHDCTDQELEAIGRDPGSMKWVRGCKTQPFTSFKVFDVKTNKWALSVTHYDDLDQYTKESENVRVTVDDQNGLNVSGPDCRTRISWTAAGPQATRHPSPE